MDTKKKKVLQALEKLDGHISQACKGAGISRSIFYLWKDQDKEFADAVEEIVEASIDLVEGKLMEKIKDGDTTCIIFFLKTRGKDRGYVERQEVTGKNGAPIALTTYRLPDGTEIEM